MILLLLALAQDAPVKTAHFDVFGSDRKEARRIAKEAEDVALRFRAIFGKRPPRGAILLEKGDRKDPRFFKGGARWTWGWERIEGAFRHELAHLLLVLTYGKEKGGYGSALPDWIDEGFAGQFDPAAMRRTFRGVVAAAVRSGSSLPLADLFTMGHPDSRNRTLRKPGNRVLWYAQTSSVFAFLEKECGRGFIRDLAERGASEALARLARRRGGTKITLDDLQAAWARSCREP